MRNTMLLNALLMVSTGMMAQTTDYKGAVVCRSQELVKSQTVLSDVQLTEGGDKESHDMNERAACRLHRGGSASGRA